MRSSDVLWVGRHDVGRVLSTASSPDYIYFDEVNAMMEIQIPAVQLVPTNDLRPDESNPNTMTDSQFEALKTVIQKYGFTVPIVTNKTYEIADGHHRWMAAQALGMASVPVIALDVDDIDRRLLRQVLNKLRGEHAIDRDAHEFALFNDANSPYKYFGGLLTPTTVDENKNIVYTYTPTAATVAHTVCHGCRLYQAP